LLLGRKLLFGFIGIVVMIVLYFFDYRKLLRYSWLLYGTTLLLMAAVHLQGYVVNGTAQWLQVGLFSINVYAISPYLLIIGIAGMLQREKVSMKGMRQGILPLAKDAVVYMLIPAFFYLTAPALAYFVLYGLGLA